MSQWIGFVAYLMSRTGLSHEEVVRIYKAGAPWPLLTQSINRRVSLYAHMFGISMEQARAAVEAWCAEEEERIATLYERATESIGQPWFEGAITALTEFPALQAMIDYSSGVTLLTGDELASVLAIHLAVLGYATEHTDWDPATSIAAMANRNMVQ
jgi:hypothetical protein